MELLQSDLTDIFEYVHKYAVHARVVHHSELYLRMGFKIQQLNLDRIWIAVSNGIQNYNSA